MNDSEVNSSDEELISKTQLKKDALALKKFGLELSQYPSDRLKKFPISETTLDSILDYQKITTNLARKRQLMFVGKCLRNEDEVAIRQYISEEFSFHKGEKKESESPSTPILKQLIVGGSEKVESLLEEHPLLERQLLRQLLRNISKSKVESKKQQAIEKLKIYLEQNLSI